jgi:subtilisin family serine protease
MAKGWTRLGLALAALALTAACAQTPPAPPAGYAELRARAEDAGHVRVIARVVAGTAGAAQGIAAFAAAGAGTAAPLSARLPLVVADVTAEQLDALRDSGEFDLFVEDQLRFATLAQSGPLVQAPELWALGGRGQDQAVAILDTGLDASHPFLAGRVTAEACFSTSSASQGASSACPNQQSQQIGPGAARPCAASGCEHGTHVAGVAAGKGAGFSGMAPDAEIIAVQVFSTFTDRASGPSPCAGSGQASPCIASFTSDQIRALDHVLSLAGQRAVASVNMSLGGGRATAFCDDDLTKPVIDQLAAAGVATVIASGNNGFTDAVSYPGCISTAVTVGATSKQDAVASFSNRGPQVDLLAPGVTINSSIPGGRFAAFSGTSMATPHVAGAFAALRSLYPQASLADIARALGSTGRPIQGRSRILLRDAATALGTAATAAATETPMAEAASAALEERIAQITALPAARPVRAIISTTRQTLDGVAAAARAAGASEVQTIPNQFMVVVEGTPAQVAAAARAPGVTNVQIDRPATTQ